MRAFVPIFCLVLAAALVARGAKNYPGNPAKSYSIGVIQDPGSELTMSMWLSQGAFVYSDTWRRIFDLSATSLLNYSGFIGVAYSAELYFADGAAGYANAAVSAGTLPTDSSWSHVVGTKSSSSNRVVWLNGVSKGTNSTDVSSVGSRTNVTIGYSPNWDPTPHQIGALGECAVWNVVLSDGEISALASGVSALRVRPASLIFYAPMESPSTNSDVNVIGKIVTHSGGVTETAHPRIYR